MPYVTVCVYFYVFVYVCVSACIFYLAYWMATPRGRGRLVDAPNFMLVLLSARGELPARARICICVCVWVFECMWLTNQFHLLALAETRQLFISIVYSAAQIFSNSNKNFIFLSHRCVFIQWMKLLFVESWRSDLKCRYVQIKLIYCKICIILNPRRAHVWHR